MNADGRHFMSIPLAGISDSPIPGKSGAMTVYRSLRLGMIGRHMCDVCV